jgi:DNA-binding transcriptional LysR family regulator
MARSAVIRLLEDWLGAALFSRIGRKVVATPAATDLLAEAGPALDRLAGD